MLRVIGNFNKGNFVSKVKDTTGLFTLNEVSKYRGFNNYKPAVSSLEQFRVDKFITTQTDIWPHNWYGMLYINKGPNLTGLVRAPNMGDDSTSIPIPQSAVGAATEYTFFEGYTCPSKRHSIVDGITHVIGMYKQTNNIASVGLYTINNITNTKTITEDIGTTVDRNNFNGIYRQGYSPDGSILYTGYSNSFVLRRRTGQTYTQLQGPSVFPTWQGTTIYIQNFAISNDSKYLVVGTDDPGATSNSGRTLAFYKIEGNTVTYLRSVIEPGYPSHVKHMAFSNDDTLLAVGGRANTRLTFYKVDKNTDSFTRFPYTEPSLINGSSSYEVGSISFSPDNSLVVISENKEDVPRSISPHLLTILEVGSTSITRTTQSFANSGNIGPVLFTNNGSTFYNFTITGMLEEYSVNGKIVEKVTETFMPNIVLPTSPGTYAATNLFMLES